MYGSSERVQDDPKEQTSLFATGSHVICKGSHTGSMGVSDHEEADARMCIHIQDAMQKGAKKILLRTVDTDVIVILAGNFFFLQSTYPDFDIWVAFGTGKIIRYLLVSP